MTKSKSQKRRAKAARQQQVNSRRKVTVNVNTKPTTRGRARRPRGRLPARGFELSKCARKYLQAIEDPFSGVKACIPTALNQPTFKTNNFARGTFQTGTNGVGGIVVSPKFCLYQGTGTGDAAIAPIVFTSSAFTGLVAPRYANIGTLYASVNTPYDNLSNVKGRTVGCGLRVRNVTAMLNRGGSGAMVENPLHQDMSLASLSAFLSMPNGGRIDVNGQWTSVVYHPIDEDENDFVGFNQLGSNAAPAVFCPWLLGCVVDGGTTNVQTYEWEVYCVNEYLGIAAAASSTPNDADPAGMGYVQNAYNSMSARLPQVGALRAMVGEQLLKASVAGAQAVGASVLRTGVAYLNNRIQQSSRINQIGYEELD